ncbi:MAG TPA: hypothetical protein VGD98_13060 [Ktedonobacteraceae bacterium]
MNILIIGGLLGLAVLAVIGAVLLGIGEERAEKARREMQVQQTSVPPLLPQQSQSRQTVSQGPTYQAQAAPATPILSHPTITLPVSNQEHTTDSLSLADLNGQVREITSELRILAQRSGELQQRLSMLSGVLENHEQPPLEPSQSDLPTDLFTSDAETQVF